ncbi:hypothetical protein [Cupriavidus taiwanensis]|uniref:hypothetical protein n=1 Tax=Cupriavidus taiwanensis TaxID=164546 RepID=UPI000E17F18D|nr:hypothetical protein [Cupriavidus taiwanensis]SOY73367.1 conserved hypothetical protein [Cupriavidus taiwanensis]SPC16620.1 conserved hypothetical protein [Cupriavidus taiwanensis]
MTDQFLFSKPFTFLACAGMTEVRDGIEALEALPGHLFWLENEDFIRRVYVPDFVAQSRTALEAAMPGGPELIDALSPEIRRSPCVLPALRQLSADQAALAHSYCYWSYCADVVGRAQGIPRSAIARQFERAVAPRDGAHKLQWLCPCCGGRAQYQVDGLLASQRPVRQGGFSLECPHCGHQERLYAGFLHAGRLECRCALCTGFVQSLAGQMARAARKLCASLEDYAWMHAVDTAAEIGELKEASLQRIAHGDRPSANAMAFAAAVQSGEVRTMPELLGRIDPTLESRLDKNPRAWALLCELLREGVVDAECTIYDHDGRKHVALEIAVLDDDPALGGGTAQDCLATLLRGYEPAEPEAFAGWLQALKRLHLCTGRFNAAVDVSWKPNLEHCRILTARWLQDTAPLASLAGPGNAPWPPAAQRPRGPERPVYLDAELEAVHLLKSLGYILLSPEDIRSQRDPAESTGLD